MNKITITFQINEPLSEEDYTDIVEFLNQYGQEIHIEEQQGE